MKRKKTIRVMLADDHAVLREGLKTLIHSQGDMRVVGETGDGKLAPSLAIQVRPDVVVMDVSMPGVNGASATRQIKEASPQIRVLALTVHEDASYLQDMLGAGASGYILKRAAANELINAVRTVAEGKTYLDPQMTDAVVESFSSERRAAAAPVAEELSERELAVAKLIAQGYTQKEIAAQLTLSTKTIETHKARLMEKLELRSRAELVRFACKQGWLASE